jgi:hypothetical protein
MPATSTPSGPDTPGEPPAPTTGTRRAAAFDVAVASLRPAQRRVFRLLLTGASIHLVADAAGVDRVQIVHWLNDGVTYQQAIDALQADLAPPIRARLHELIIAELTAQPDDHELEATARAILAVIRAIGRLDIETSVLDRSALRADRWPDRRG